MLGRSARKGPPQVIEHAPGNGLCLYRNFRMKRTRAGDPVHASCPNSLI